ncbi:ribonuclease H family protein [Liquorilactobacillus mali]|uniref:ribonuclease H family protein n=1 Tax=Liquorilactobacillus mali TaxID=1618 RepID=UPI0002491E04|nr:ribonuclease H family protein [Liquorilactobacillus mali]EJF01458.1 RNase HI [Liquorilactobacillus mali KCTC 3596 = DSM 20444]MDC7953872.1 viroplasmin family protein [Liquorilactobacillus mali]QFQ75216.1 RNase HI [Liquorilactobacillus mali]
MIKIAFKYYVVSQGRKPGIYKSWSECQVQVQGYQQARFKGFNDFGEAKAWLGNPNKFIQKTSNQMNNSSSLEKQAEIILWTDGGSRNNGNKKGQHVKKDDKAAWAFLFINNNENFSQSAGEYGATNNRMEIMALLMALKELERQSLNNNRILAILDSRYVLDAVNKNWLSNWKRRGWKTSAGKQVANQELWQELAIQLNKFPNISFSWTKGHLNNKGNIFVDELLNKTMDKM